MIEFKNVYKTYPNGFTALKNINLQIEQGEFVAIIGLSGAGKSTILRCINRMHDISKGELTVDGVTVDSLRGKELRRYRRKVGMIFQSFNLLEQRTALDNICFPLELEGVPKAKAKQRARELLEIVGLPDKARAYPVQLSGGQKQRIAIARALASDPEVLLCDEATSALDPQTTNSILNLLQTISRERGITVILITHQMSVIEQICNRVAILDSGVVAEIGDVEQVFSNPQSAAGRRLVSPDVALPLSTWVGPVARIAFNGNTSEEPIIAEVAMEKGIKLSILGADTRNVDGKAFGTMLVSLPEDAEKKQEVLDYLNHFDGVTAEVIQ